MEKKRIVSAKKRKEIKEFIHGYKENKHCLVCGYKENTDILVFHHRDPEKKEFKIAKKNSTSIENIIKEIEKCDLLCPNCHRELHWRCNNG